MRRVTIYTLGLSLALLGAGCGGSSSSSSDRAAAVAPVVSAAPVVPTARVTGRVTHQGAPAGGAFLILASRGTGDAADVDPASLFTDASGAFAIDAPLDDYDVIAVTADGLVAEARLDLTGGAPATLDLSLGLPAIDVGAIGPGTLQRLLSAGPLNPDASLLTEED